MVTGGKIRIAAHVEVDWLEQSFAPAVCPNCGTQASVRRYLDIDYRPPKAAHRFVLQICPHCTVRFVDNTETMDYSDEGLIEIGWHAYQVQLGAGIWPISAPLTRIEKPVGARVLEIGGAYGFGLDFCIQARGWRGEGYDPSPLAGFGARGLGLTIHPDYFEEKDLSAGPWDVAIATELVEHLEHPPAFFSLMRRALAEDGILVLTTPDAEWITPSLEAGALMPLLSPGAHMVLQTETSLRHALQGAGFGHVVVVRESMSLVVYASPSPFALGEDASAARAMYRRYLMERGKLTAKTRDLRFGFAGRGLFEAANDGDHATAEAAWAVLAAAAREDFGIGLETMQSLPEGVDDASLAELAQLIPLGLGMILFGRSMHLLNTGTSRAVLLPMLRNAGRAVTALQNALAKRSLRDGLSVNIQKIIDCEILLCLAEAADPGCVPGLVALGDTVAGWRGFVALVNAGALDLAGKLKEALLPDMPAGDVPRDLRRNILLSLANFALAPGGETMRAFDYACALRELGEPNDDIILGAFTRLVNAANFATARQTLHLVEPILIKLLPPYDEAARNALFTAGILFLQKRDDWRRSVTIFARLRDALVKRALPGTTPDALFWPAMRGEVLALHQLNRGADATSLLETFIGIYPDAPDDLLKQIERPAS